jgi:hypothetical protein
MSHLIATCNPDMKNPECLIMHGKSVPVEKIVTGAIYGFNGT